VLDILNITENSEHWLKNAEQILNITENSEQSLNITENFEHWLNILNIDWTESEHYWTFWTLTEQILNILKKCQI
jgi:hypothetical protein